MGSNLVIFCCFQVFFALTKAFLPPIKQFHLELLSQVSSRLVNECKAHNLRYSYKNAFCLLFKHSNTLRFIIPH